MVSSVEQPKHLIETAEFGSPKDYDAFSPKEAVAEILASQGIAPEFQLLDGYYGKKDGSMGVGVAEITDQMCEGHFIGNPILRAVDRIAMIHQANILRQYYAGYLNGDVPSAPMRLDKVSGLTFMQPAVVGAIANVLIKEVAD